MSSQAPIKITVDINGRPHSTSVSPRLLLSDFLRDVVGLTGTHVGCEQGVCGACTIWLDDQPVRSCLMFAAQVDGQRLTTVEGLGGDNTLTPLQRAFSQCHALQCGFCTPGILMSATALLRKQPRPDEHAIRDLLAGHLCRCTGYSTIVHAIAQAADETQSEHG